MAKKSKKKNNQHQRAYFAAEYANHIMNFYGVDREMSCADLKSILCAPRIFSQMGNDPVQALNVERSLFAMMKWRKAKQAYRFNPVFLEELSTNVSLNFPFSAWHLPFSSYYVDLLNWDKKINDEPIYGAYFYFGPADHNGIEDTLLTITIVTEAVNQRTNLFRMINFSIFLSGDEQLTVHDAISQISDYGEIHEDSKTLVSDSTHLAETLCMIASYISSSEPDIKKREKWIGATRIQNGKTIRSTVQLWDVGYRFYKDCIKKISKQDRISAEDECSRISASTHPKGTFSSVLVRKRQERTQNPLDKGDNDWKIHGRSANRSTAGFPRKTGKAIISKIINWRCVCSASIIFFPIKTQKLNLFSRLSLCAE